MGDSDILVVELMMSVDESGPILVILDVFYNLIFQIVKVTLNHDLGREIQLVIFCHVN